MNEVVWIDTLNMFHDNTVAHKLNRLIHESGAIRMLAEDMRVALKLNTSEEGYAYGLRPDFISPLSGAAFKATGKRPVVCDGQRLVDYWKRSGGNAFMETTSRTGYSSETLGGHFVINGGFSGDEGDLFPCGEDSELGGVEVGTAVCRSDALWVLSHVTLNPLFGLCGALYNGGFDCLSSRAKTRVLKGTSPYLFNGQRPPSDELAAFRSRALECHKGVRAAMEGRVFYINYLWDVTPQPEYYPYSDSPLVENLGFLGSADPVALDAVTFEMLSDRIPDFERLAGGAFGRTLEKAESIGVGAARHRVRRLS